MRAFGARFEVRSPPEGAGRCRVRKEEKILKCPMNGHGPARGKFRRGATIASSLCHDIMDDASFLKKKRHYYVFGED